MHIFDEERVFLIRIIDEECVLLTTAGRGAGGGCVGAEEVSGGDGGGGDGDREGGACKAGRGGGGSCGGCGGAVEDYGSGAVGGDGGEHTGEMVVARPENHFMFICVSSFRRRESRSEITFLSNIRGGMCIEFQSPCEDARAICCHSRAVSVLWTVTSQLHFATKQRTIVQLYGALVRIPTLEKKNGHIT